MTEEGEIRLKFSLHADWYLLLWTGHQCIQTTTSMTATALGLSLHPLAKWSRSSESKGWRFSCMKFQPNLKRVPLYYDFSLSLLGSMYSSWRQVVAVVMTTSPYMKAIRSTTPSY